MNVDITQVNGLDEESGLFQPTAQDYWKPRTEKQKSNIILLKSSNFIKKSSKKKEAKEIGPQVAKANLGGSDSGLSLEAGNWLL